MCRAEGKNVDWFGVGSSEEKSAMVLGACVTEKMMVPKWSETSYEVDDCETEGKSEDDLQTGGRER